MVNDSDPQLTVRPYAMPAMYRFLPHFSLTCALGKADVRSVSWVSSIGRRRGTEITKADCGSNNGNVGDWMGNQGFQRIRTRGSDQDDGPMDKCSTGCEMLCKPTA